MPTDRTGIGTGHMRGLNVSEGVSLLLAGVATLSTIPKELTQIVPARHHFGVNFIVNI